MPIVAAVARDCFLSVQWRMKMKKQVKVGDYVGFKYDIEQTGKVIAIEKNSYGETVYTVLATRGEYASRKGTPVVLGADEIW
jgi:hypothetical protein